MTTDAEKKILEQAITAIRARAAERLEADSSQQRGEGGWYLLGVQHATDRAIQEIELLRDAW
jgi:hypothetical protein